MMNKAAIPFATLLLAVASAGAVADVTCTGPQQNGNTWQLVCAEDGSGDADFQCNYQISVTNKDGQTDVVEASGTVGKGQSGIVLWSGAEHMGSDIVAASVARGSCEQE